MNKTAVIVIACLGCAGGANAGSMDAVGKMVEETGDAAEAAGVMTNAVTTGYLIHHSEVVDSPVMIDGEYDWHPWTDNIIEKEITVNIKENVMGVDIRSACLLGRVDFRKTCQ